MPQIYENSAILGAVHSFFASNNVFFSSFWFYRVTDRHECRYQNPMAGKYISLPTNVWSRNRFREQNFGQDISVATKLVDTQNSRFYLALVKSQ
jgi:hypothetical protein